MYIHIIYECITSSRSCSSQSSRTRRPSSLTGSARASEASSRLGGRPRLGGPLEGLRGPGEARLPVGGRAGERGLPAARLAASASQRPSGMAAPLEAATGSTRSGSGPADGWADGWATGPSTPSRCKRALGLCSRGPARPEGTDASGGGSRRGRRSAAMAPTTSSGRSP